MTIAGLPTTDLSILHVQDNCRVTLPESAAFTDATSTISYDLSAAAPEHAIARIAYEYNGRQIGATYLIHNALGAAATQPAIEVTTEAPSTEAPDAETAGANLLSADGPADSSLADSQMAGARRAGEPGESAPPAPDDNNPDKAVFRIPAPLKIALIAIAVCLLLGGAVVLLKLHIEKREEAERMARYRKRQQRLEDIGMSSAEFDLLLQQKRSSPGVKQGKRPRRPKRHKSFLDSKR